MAEQPRHSVSVAAIIVDEDGRVVCIQRRDNGHWEPPGGVLELGERIDDGLVREVAEETGLIVSAEALTGVYQNQPNGIVALVFRATVTGGHIRCSNESTDVAWLTKEEVTSRMLPAYAVRIIDALNHRGEVPLRVHDGRNLIESLGSCSEESRTPHEERGRGSA